MSAPNHHLDLRLSEEEGILILRLYDDDYLHYLYHKRADPEMKT